MTDENIRTLKILTCPSVTGKSKLTYAIGIDETDAIYMSIRSNSGGGFFSAEWVAIADILEALGQKPEEITSYLLHPLLRGKSVNTQSFLLAAIKHEKLVVPLKGRQRKYQLQDPKQFLAKVKKLASAKTSATIKKKVSRRRKPAA